MSTFMEWAEEKRNQANVEREELLHRGTTDSTQKETDKFHRMMDHLFQLLRDGLISPLSYGHERVHFMPFRTTEEFGVSIEVFGSPRDQVEFSRPRFDQSVQYVKYEDRDLFDAAFKEANDRNYYIELADEPMRLRIGFLVCKGDGIVWHSIKREDYSKATFEELRKMGFGTGETKPHMWSDLRDVIERRK